MSIFSFKRNKSSSDCKGTACLLIDYENLAISLKENRSSESLDLSPILAIAKERSCEGRIDVIQAYADWRHFAQHANTLVRLGIKTVQAPSFRFQGKNATDIQMAVEATDLLHLHPELQTFFLATGDSDFTPLVQLLRSRGKKVIGIGVSGSVSRQLQTVCDDFILYEDLLPSSKNRVTPSEKTDGEPQRRRATAHTEVRESGRGYKARPTTVPPSQPSSSVTSVAGNSHNGSTESNGGTIELRELIGLDPQELLISERLKQLLPLAAEAWNEVKPEYAPQMRRALLRRFPDQVSTFEAQVISGVLEKTGGLGDAGWIVIGGSDGDLLFDLLLHSSQQTLIDQGRTEVEDPQRLGELMLQDSVARPELRMRLVRGRSAAQKFTQTQ